MKITKISEQKNNKDRFNIFIDNEYAFALDINNIIKFKIKKGMILDDFLLEKLKEEEANRKAINLSLNYLSYRIRSEKEVRDYLYKKDIQEDSINQAINYLLDYGYLDDEAFCLSYAKDKINLNKLGRNRLYRELIDKGIKPHIINSTLENLINHENEYETCLALAKKRISSYKNDDYQSKYRKLSSYLARRGYDYSMIRKIVDLVIDDE